MDFYERAARICLMIPQGKLASYGQIARLCGKPKNARQVGYGLRSGRIDSAARMLGAAAIPAHRIVNAKGELAGAGHFLTWDLQKNLLVSEGVAVAWDGKIWRADMDRFGWKPSGEEVQKMQAGSGEDE